MKLKALKYMRYARNAVQVGDIFEANAADVRVLVALKRAEVYVDPPKARTVAAVFRPITPYVAASVEAEPAAKADESGEDKPKRTYKRRDMQAE